MEEFKIKNGVINAIEGIQNEIAKKAQGTNSREDQMIITLNISLIERAKTIKLLEENDKNESIGVLTRSFFELYVSLEYMLESDTKNRVKSFYYDSLISGLKKVIKLDEEFPDIPDSDVYGVQDYSSEFPDVKTKKELLDRVEIEYEKLFFRSDKNSRKWYSLEGNLHNFKDLCNMIIKDESLYNMFYGFGSLDTHGSGAIGSVQEVDGKIIVEPTIPIKLCNAFIVKYMRKVTFNLIDYYKIKSSKIVKSNITLLRINEPNKDFLRDNRS